MENSRVDYGLIKLVYNIIEYMEKYLTLGVFIDISREFDIIDQSILFKNNYREI